MMIFLLACYIRQRVRLIAPEAQIRIEACKGFPLRAFRKKH